MREKYSTVTIGGVDYPLPIVSSDWIFDVPPRSKTCDEIVARYREWPDYSIVHERCDDATCEICNRVFGDKK